MSCPHCNYDPDEKNENNRYPSEGIFYKLPINLERPNTDSYYKSKDEVNIFGCPKCRKTFISLWD